MKKLLILLFMLFAPVYQVFSQSVVYTRSNSPSIGTYIDTDGYTVPATKWATAKPLDPDAQVNSQEACITNIYTKTVSATATNSDGFINLRLVDLLNYDKVNLTITRTVGTAKELDGYFLWCKKSNTASGASSIANTMGVYTQWCSNGFASVVNSQATSINRDFNMSNILFNPSGTNTVNNTVIGTPPVDSLTIEDLFYFVQFDNDSGSTTFEAVTTYYKCSDIGVLTLKAGDVLTGSRWQITEYNN